MRVDLVAEIHPAVLVHRARDRHIRAFSRPIHLAYLVFGQVRVFTVDRVRRGTVLVVPVVVQSTLRPSSVE